MALWQFRRKKQYLLIMASFIIMSFGFAITSYAQYNALYSDAEIPTHIQQIINPSDPGAGGNRGILSKKGFLDKQAVSEIYEQRSFKPIWVGRKKNMQKSQEILDVLEASWAHGLNPDNYHVSLIRELIANPSVDKAQLELIITDAVMRYGHDVTGMRINPSSIAQKQEYWRESLNGKAVMEKVLSSHNPAKALAQLAPNTRLYNALKEELVRLSSEENSYDHILPLRFGGDHHFAPGERHRDVKSLRIRLGMPEGESSAYDDDTAAAVMSFQRKHGLETDGIIGPQTLAVLNRTNKDKMEQVIANLERLRWLDQNKPEKYIVVNIPQQLLWAVNQGDVEHEMKVVVGQPRRKTKEFKTEVTGVRLNPTWTVPLRLKMEDFLPKLLDNPDYLTNKRINVIRGVGSNAEYLDPHDIEWSDVDRSEMNQLRFVQSPGSNNALGQVRILMPNQYNIYMHDTNHPEYFERDQRTYSSGCIRLSEPQKLAHFVMDGTEGWSEQKMQNIIASGKRTDISIDESFPVYIIYQSIWLDQQNRIVYGSDVYKRDQSLIKVLANIDGYLLPDASDTRFASLVGDSKTSLAYNK